MEKRLAELGLSYTVFRGVDGKAEEKRLLESVDVDAFERNMGRRILIGGIGCYHSHLGVWREFIASGESLALVLEDDVIFHDDFMKAVTVGISAAGHWDFLKLNSIRAKLPILQGRLGRYELNAYLGPATGTGAYLIKRDLAQRLLKSMLPITRSTDHEINRFFFHDFRLLGLQPFPSELEQGMPSLITGSNYSDVRKLPKLQRLPYYRLKAANYFRRLAWLSRNRMIWPSDRAL